jgi:hypothetical protein
LQVIDVRNPASPRIVGSVDAPGSAYGVAVAAGFAYVADCWAGLLVIDVRNPASPRIVGSADTPGRAYDVTVVDGFAYVVGRQGPWPDYRGWLMIVDVRDPTSLSPVRYVDTPDRAYDVAVAAGLAHVADGASGLEVIDVNPHLKDVHAPSADRLAATVPAGFRCGPYHVRVTQPDGDGNELYKGFRVCERRALALELEPSALPESPQIFASPLNWRARLNGDEQLFDWKAKRETELKLPKLPENLETEFTPSPDPGLSVIELHLAPGPEQGLVKLIGADEDAMRAQWDAIVEAGGIALPPLNDHTYEDVELTLQRSPANVAPSDATRGAQVGVAPIVYRYEFTDCELTAARAWGTDVDHVFRATAIYDWTCEVEDSVSYVETLTALCEGHAAAHPELVMDCTP